MIIRSMINGLKRARAMVKEAQAQAGPKASMGMFALIERPTGFTPCTLSSVTYDGVVRKVRVVGQKRPLWYAWQQVMIFNRVGDPEGLVAKLVDEKGNAIEFNNRDEAVAAIKAAGSAP